MRYLLVSTLCLTLVPAAAALAQSAPKLAAAPAGPITPQEATTCVEQTIACEQTIQGSLDPGDCKLADGTAYDDFQFSGTNGETVTATLSSTAFTPLLDLLNPNGITKTSNNGPGSVQVQLVLDATGTWTLRANNNETSFMSGPYSLSLHCGAAPTGCIPSDTTLCVGNSRFSVRATFDDGHGNAGQAHAVALTGDTGYFWFFSSTNVEMVTKLLDACPLNNRFWFFAGGLTNVHVVTTVLDTKTQTTKTYRNPPNTTFLPVQDTSAFATCP
jgi:hypothetical protein